MKRISRWRQQKRITVRIRWSEWRRLGRWKLVRAAQSRASVPKITAVIQNAVVIAWDRRQRLSGWDSSQIWAFVRYCSATRCWVPSYFCRLRAPHRQCINERWLRPIVSYSVASRRACWTMWRCQMQPLLKRSKRVRKQLKIYGKSRFRWIFCIARIGRGKLMPWLHDHLIESKTKLNTTYLQVGGTWNCSIPGPIDTPPHRRHVQSDARWRAAGHWRGERLTGLCRLRLDVCARISLLINGIDYNR